LKVEVDAMIEVIVVLIEEIAIIEKTAIEETAMEEIVIGAQEIIKERMIATNKH
jgi:hypothetical protein